MKAKRSKKKKKKNNKKKKKKKKKNIKNRSTLSRISIDGAVLLTLPPGYNETQTWRAVKRDISAK